MVSFIYGLNENDRDIFNEYLKNMDTSLKNDLFDKIKNQIDNSLFEIDNMVSFTRDSEYIDKENRRSETRRIDSKKLRIQMNSTHPYRICYFGSQKKINFHKGLLPNEYQMKYRYFEPHEKYKPIISTESLIVVCVELPFHPKEIKLDINKIDSLKIDVKIKFTPDKLRVVGQKPGWFSTEDIKSYSSETHSFRVFEYEKVHQNNFKDLTTLKYGEKPFNELEQEYIDFFKKFDVKISELLKEVYEGMNEFKNEINNVLVDLDTDNNGQLDLIEGGGDYLPLLKKHQSKIVEIDRTYIQQFIKVSNYLTQKKQNLQVIFERLKDSVNQSQLDELGEILKQEIHTYNIILLNSLHMINSLVEDDMITFYDIYEKFDKLNMFTSNWENQVTEKLDEVNLNLVELMKELRDVGDRIVGSIDNLSYITEESTRQLTSKMEEIDSTLKAGNLINVIQTYQMYKVNKSTKSLKG